MYLRRFIFFQLYVFLKSSIKFCYSGPNAPPSNLQAHNTSSTSVLVQWGDVPLADQNGIILSYKVTYTALPKGSPETKVVNASTTEVILTGLNEYTNYSISVFASTAKGDGNITTPIIVVTDQDSKLSLTINFSFLIPST